MLRIILSLLAGAARQRKEEEKEKCGQNIEEGETGYTGNKEFFRQKE